MTQNALNNTASVFDVDNINLDGNTISSTDTNGNIILDPDGTGVVVVGDASSSNYISQLRSASGQWLNWNDATDSFGFYNYAGSPEGNVTANIGSLCTDTTNGALYVKQTDSANTGWVIAGGGDSQLVQYSYSTSSTGVTGTAQIPADNTIPQITEGTQVMTHTHTPLSDTNILLIAVTTYAIINTSTHLVSAALFEQGTNDALVANNVAYSSSTRVGTSPFTLRHSKVSGTTSTLTYELRAGNEDGAATFYVNRTSVGAQWSTAGNILFTVMEFLP